MDSLLAEKKIILGVTGSIAAYKAADIVRRLRERGAEVQVVMTASAKNFITEDTLRNLSGRPTLSEMFAEPVQWDVKHISLAEWADLILIAPATAQTLAALACGLADELLTSVVLATDAPVLIAPAMNDRMWAHKATQDNVARLQEFGYSFVEPESGPLASGKTGQGRLAAIPVIIAETEALLSPRDLCGLRVVINSGPTHEPIDAVRFISNRSSGKMGYALAAAARRRGAAVTLVSGPTAMPAPYGVEVVSVETAAQMHKESLAQAKGADLFIGAAAVGDFAPKKSVSGKMKRQGEHSLRLLPTEDCISAVAALRRKRPKVVVGFAAETEDLLANAKAKLAKKGIDLVVANDITQPDGGFGSDFNQVSLLFADGKVEALPRLSKIKLADEILRVIKSLLDTR